MKNFGLYFCVVFLNSIFELNGQFNNVCVMCSQYFESKCEVNVSTVYYDKIDQEKVLEAEEAAQSSPQLEECLDYTFTITEDANGFMCSLSRTLGCNVIVHKEGSTNPSHNKGMCTQCAIKYCKCKDWKSNGQSRNLPSTVMKAMMLASCLTLISMNH